ncbi:hypothetical protein [Aporhodopirellula aestuarii]|uniref:Uncharacterized protein n=1 Tax=Aporhodopirellula aestuarii TaxID=2950107 RepID=A0ABT0TYB7_9BACT|nr:hypothetical protein [Aporhodopirellula aestuarii]MCM2369576.1 hypothetical protein [Aporhodopirellula aestuarii]
MLAQNATIAILQCRWIALIFTTVCCVGVSLSMFAVPLFARGGQWFGGQWFGGQWFGGQRVRNISKSNRDGATFWLVTALDGQFLTPVIDEKLLAIASIVLIAFSFKFL